MPPVGSASASSSYPLLTCGSFVYQWADLEAQLIDECRCIQVEARPRKDTFDQIDSHVLRLFRLDISTFRELTSGPALPVISTELE